MWWVVVVVAMVVVVGLVYWGRWRTPMGLGDVEIHERTGDIDRYLTGGPDI